LHTREKRNGLAEKRWAQERKKNDEASFVSQLKATTGNDIPVEIDWDGFSGVLAAPRR